VAASKRYATVTTLTRLAAESTDEAFRVAIAAGLASIPVSLLLSWDSLAGDAAATGAEFDGLALLAAAVAVGYYYHDRPTSTTRAGLWTGLTGGLAALVVFGRSGLAAVVSASPERAGVLVVVTAVFAVLSVGLSVGVAVVAASGTDWLLGRVDPETRIQEPADADRQSDDGHQFDEDCQPDRSRWWLAVVVYAVLAPVWLAILLWPGAAFGFGISFLSALGLFVCSLVAFVGLFLDATAPRAADAWRPTWWLYVGVPPTIAGVVTLASTLQDAGYPAGDGIFGFYAALAAVAVVYAANRHRQVGTLLDPK